MAGIGGLYLAYHQLNSTKYRKEQLSKQRTECFCFWRAPTAVIVIGEKWSGKTVAVDDAFKDRELKLRVAITSGKEDAVVQNFCKKLEIANNTYRNILYIVSI